MKRERINKLLDLIDLLNSRFSGVGLNAGLEYKREEVCVWLHNYKGCETPGDFDRYTTSDLLDDYNDNGVTRTFDTNLEKAEQRLIMELNRLEGKENERNSTGANI